MRTTSRKFVALATGLAVALGVTGAAIGSSGSGPKAVIQALGGDETQVKLDAQTLSALQKAGVKVAPISPAKLGNGTVSFPITGGDAFVYPVSQAPYVRGTIDHSGGLKLSAGGKTVRATHFEINPGTSRLIATINGKTQIPLFFLDGRDLQISQDGGATVLQGTHVKLDPVGASALDKAFGVSTFKPYTSIGVATIRATSLDGS
jgi:hypothetical protein